MSGWQGSRKRRCARLRSTIAHSSRNAGKIDGVAHHVADYSSDVPFRDFHYLPEMLIEVVLLRAVLAGYRGR